MALKLYNALTKSKDDFVPIDPDHVRMYACGPTVYNYAHIGNARMAVVCDVLVRVLRHRFQTVTYVSNITDIDDKIIAASRDTSTDIKALTDKYTRIYNDDMGALNVITPDIQPRATDYIPQMIDQINRLIANNHAYEKDGHVLFHTVSYPQYGALSGRSRNEQIAGARVEVAPYKKDAADFVLWKPSHKDEPGWDSPFGYGRPGWHIECSAMSEATLSLPFDIHGGGADLKFPHHENEIAQACGACGFDDPQQFAKYWVHNGFVTVQDEKMSKSIGNVSYVHDLIKQHKGEILRLALMSAQYRKPLNWTDDLIRQTEKTLNKFYKLLHDVSATTIAEDAIDHAVYAPLYDDMNVPQLLANMNGLLKSETDPVVMKSTLQTCGDLIGIFQTSPDTWFDKHDHSGDIDADKVNAMIARRDQAKAQKDFTTADGIRDTLKSMGITIIDTPGGTTWEARS